MGSGGYVEQSRMSVSTRDMSSKRDYNGPIDNCEAEDLSMPVRKRLKEISTIVQQSNNGVTSRYKDFKPSSSNSSVTHSFAFEMDIKEPLTTLRSLVEEKLGHDLSSATISLQNTMKLEPSTSLGDQCIQSNGRAEIKVEVIMLDDVDRINILDVLKLSQDEDEEVMDEEEEYEENSSVEDLSIKTHNNNCNNGQLDDRSDSSSLSDSTSSRSTSFPWSIMQDVSTIFPIAFPNNPVTWNEEHTQLWLRWAIKEFNIKFVDDSMWTLTGKQFSQMTEQEFHQKVPLDPKKLFWTHTDLLKRCGVFAVPDKSGRSQITISSGTKPAKKTISRKPRIASATSAQGNGGNMKRAATMTGHNGQIQLWQFLLELLGDKNSKSVIQWVGREGEFKLNDPELVAQMWGQRKNKPKMNYEKLSRALRYYYSEAMIAKVHGRRFVYKFVCNLKELIGYSTEELINLVEDEPVVFESLD